MIKKQVIIVDNFFKNPHTIRKIALEQDYFKDAAGTYSGKRTRDLCSILPELSKKTAANILEYYGESEINYSYQSYFHFTEEKFGDIGWVHQDYETYSCVIYLNPDLRSLNSGTSLFVESPAFNPHNFKGKELRESFINEQDNLNDKITHNSNFIKTVTVGGVFNRLVAYPGMFLHAGEGYFGSSKEDSRLTMLYFFNKIK